jgi:hypothetical protein
MVDKITTVSKSKFQMRISDAHREARRRRDDPLSRGALMSSVWLDTRVNELKDVHRAHKREYARLVEAPVHPVDRWSLSS